MKESITNLAEFVKKKLNDGHEFDECWTIVGSGALTRALQRANIATAYRVVSVNGVIPDESIRGNANFILHKQPLCDMVPPEDNTPFMSSPYHEAKAWKHLLEEAKANPKKIYLFWNSF